MFIIQTGFYNVAKLFLFLITDFASTAFIVCYLARSNFLIARVFIERFYSFQLKGNLLKLWNDILSLLSTILTVRTK